MPQEMINALVGDTELRPLRQGEFVSNPDGSRSTERTITIPIGSKFTNVPTLWMRGGEPISLGEKESFDAALKFMERTGELFPMYDTMGSAVDDARKRSASGGAFSGKITGRKE